MDLTDIKELYRNSEAYFDKEVTVGGWVRSIRDSKTFGFIVANDGTFFEPLQIVYADKLENFDAISKLNVGSAIVARGKIVATPQAKQKFEMQAEEIIVEGMSTADYPLQKKRHSFEYLRTISHLRPRTNTFQAVFRVRSLIAYAIHTFFQERGFVYVHTPIITGSDCEGAGEMFHVTTLAPGEQGEDFFNRPCSLTVSGQLEAEALALGLGRVYTFGPTFRAENSNTPRHAAEFWMIEPEMAFADLEDLMELGESLTRHVVEQVLARCGADVALFDRFVEPGLLERLRGMLRQPFARIPYAEAVQILADADADFAYPVSFGIDLQTEHERYLAETHFQRPVIVYDYPREIKAFYMRANDDGETVAAMDMLVPRIGELIGGSQREERLDLLEARMAELGQKPEDYWWYLDLRRFGSVPHAGFGLGFERLLMFLTGISNIRDVIPFPRTPGSLEF